MKSLIAVRRAAYYVGPLLLWMVFIFEMSTSHGSAQATTPTVNSLLRTLFPFWFDRMPASDLSQLDWYIRKSAHVFEYTIFTLLTFRALAFGSKRFQQRAVWGTLLLGIGYGSSDEYHQIFVPGRGPSVNDVFIDTFGVLLGLLLCIWGRATRMQRRLDAGVQDAEVNIIHQKELS